MQQAVFHRYDDVRVAAEFRCRGDDLLGIYADAIREQVETMRDLRLQDDEYHWLSQPALLRARLSRLAARLPLRSAPVTVTNDNGKLNIRLYRAVAEVIMWEVPLLAVISELVHRYRSPEITVTTSAKHLEHKLSDFSHHHR